MQGGLRVANLLVSVRSILLYASNFFLCVCVCVCVRVCGFGILKIVLYKYS
jgi:hypothetical protein